MDKKIFISHATKDKQLIDLFVDDLLVGVLQVKLENIFYTSGDGTKIKSGEDWRNSIRTGLLKSDVIVLLVSPAYKESEMCICEMGAAWTTDKLVIPIVIPPINYTSVGVIYEPNQMIKLLDTDALDRVKDQLQNALEIKTVATDRWSAKKRQFLKEAEQYLKSNPYPKAIARPEFDSLAKEKDSLEKDFEQLTIELKQKSEMVKALEKVKDASQVKIIKKQFNDNSNYDEFHQLCEEVTDSLRPLKPIIRGVIFRSYNSKSLKFDWQGYKDDIEEAEAESFLSIDEDEGLIEIDWTTTDKMRRVYLSLQALNIFMNQTQTQDFDDNYHEEYDAPFMINNKSFWDEVFRLQISLK